MKHFQGCQYALESKLPGLPSNPENPFLQNGNTPLGKSLTYSQGKTALRA